MRIVLTGGGTAGHVTPHLALIEVMEKKGWRIDYIGSKTGIERQMMEREGIPYHAISTGKLYRYWTWKLLKTPFQVICGIFEAYRLMRRIRPTLVFSKGGFVAFPVVFAAWLLQIPVVAHESDLTPGLANRLSFPFASRLCVVLDSVRDRFNNKKKVVVTGSPIRSALFQGNAKAAFKQCHFKGKKPVILLMGGSLGAQSLNQMIREALPLLCQKYHVIHLCGKGNVDIALNQQPDYFQCEYAYDEMADLLALSDVVISRAGANSIYELLALGKPHILIPLANATRGDQLHNAAYFEKQGVSVVLPQTTLTQSTLLESIDQVWRTRKAITKRIQALHFSEGTEKVMQVLCKIQSRIA